MVLRDRAARDFDPLPLRRTVRLQYVICDKNKEGEPEINLQQIGQSHVHKKADRRQEPARVLTSFHGSVLLLAPVLDNLVTLFPVKRHRPAVPYLVMPPLLVDTIIPNNIEDVSLVFKGQHKVVLILSWSDAPFQFECVHC